MRTRHTPLSELTVGGFLDELAARVPAPGGGATAALHAAQAAALVGMVARYTTGPKYAPHADLIAGIVERSDVERARALRLVADDAAAFTVVAEAYGLSTDTPEAAEHRSAAIARARAGAAKPPAEVIRVAESALSLAEAVLPVANRNVVTDVGAASEAARAAATTARLNVAINLGGIRDEEVRADLLSVLELVDPVTERAAAVERAVREMVS